MPYANGPRKRNPKVGLPPRKCKSCGEEFIPYRSNHVVCSRRCRSRLPEEIAKAKERNATPEARARVLAYRRMLTATDPDRLRRYNLRGAMKKYGVTIDWFESKLAEQDGRCMVCGATPDPDGVKAAARLHVDHDHETGAVRDLLCTRCNQGLGYFRDNPNLLRAAAEYIERHRNLGEA